MALRIRRPNVAPGLRPNAVAVGDPERTGTTGGQGHTDSYPRSPCHRTPDEREDKR